MVNTNKTILQRTGHSMEYLIKSNIRGILNMTKNNFTINIWKERCDIFSIAYEFPSKILYIFWINE